MIILYDYIYMVCTLYIIYCMYTIYYILYVHVFIMYLGLFFQMNKCGFAWDTKTG